MDDERQRGGINDCSMNNDGYIHSHRRDRDHWTWKDPYYRWWADIRYEVNFKPGGTNIKGKHIECGRGQSIRSYASWADRWCVDKNKVRRFFDLLVKHKEISIEVIPNRTIRLTVMNYNYISPCADPYKSTTAKDTEYQRTPSGPLESEKSDPYIPTGTMDTEYQWTPSITKNGPNRRREEVFNSENSSGKKETSSELDLTSQNVKVEAHDNSNMTYGEKQKFILERAEKKKSGRRLFTEEEIANRDTPYDCTH